jgi:hypothetical protein
VERLYAPGGSVLIDTVTLATNIGDAGHPITLDIANPTYTISPNPFLTSSSQTNSTPVTSAWQIAGGGTINLIAKGNNATSMDHDGFWTETDWVQSNAGVSVTYTYDPVSTPEPVSMALSGAGLLVVGFFGRKRFQRAK